METAPETILSVARENRALRWGIVILTFGIAVLAVALAYKPAPMVWVVGENGTLYRGDSKIMSWEPIEATRQALDLVFVPTDNRENLVRAFFDTGYQIKILGMVPRDPFIAFHVKRVMKRIPHRLLWGGC